MAVSKTPYWSTREIVLIGTMGAVMGVLYWGFSQAYNVYSDALGKVGSQFAYGLWFIGGILIPYILRKPWAAFLGEAVAASVSMLLGTTWGVDTAVSGILQGLGSEAAFALGRYRRYGAGTMMLAGMIPGIPAFAHDYLVYGYAEYQPAINIGMFLILLVSGALMGGLLSKAIGDALARTGTLDNYPIGRERRKGV
ncbi:MAG: ECF transporter S component [Armatimonadetes bacterium]|nr:ECF transporter S component [Armatimonadota bacterium]